MRYEILESLDSQRLSEMVNAALGSGATLLGSVVTDCNPNRARFQDTRFVQAIVWIDKESKTYGGEAPQQRN
jgi:hypothetical protein